MSDNKLILTTVYGRKMLIHLSNDVIERLQIIEDENNYPIGTVVLGRVKKMIPSSNACFVNIGNGTDYFLPLPIEPGILIFSDGKKHEKVHQEDEILVQIETEAIKSKQPSLTAKVCLTGRYFVVEAGKGLSFSKKINAGLKEKIILPTAIDNYKNKYRIVVRTEAGQLFENICKDDAAGDDTYLKQTQILEKELNEMLKSMDHIFSHVHSAVNYEILYRPDGRLEQCMKTWLKYGVTSLVTDQAQYLDLMNSLAESHGQAGPADRSEHINDNSGITVRFYDDDDLPLYKLYKLETLVDGLISRKVFLRSGGFLVVEQGETLTAIDVNTAHAVKGSKEETVFKTNMEAADEIAHVLRSRNLNGMILVDFINMKDKKNVDRLISHMKELLAHDDVRSSYVDMTGLGLMEITRQRKYKSLIEQWKSS